MSPFKLEVQELRRPSVVYSLTVKWSNTIKDIKGMIQTLGKFPSDRMQILRSANSAPINDAKTLGEVGIDQVGHTLVVSLKFGANPQYALEPAGGISLDAKCRELVSQVRLGLNSSQNPAKTDMLDCTGGVYFMKSNNSNLVAVFKPQDEEQGMPSNPKGHAGAGVEGLRANIKPGDGYLHEVAAYLMDRDNFCQVPPTVLAHCEHPSFNYSSTLHGDLGMFPKIGSLQQYVRASDTFEDISPSLIGTLELQKIALLDMRLLNCDRNASNILAIRKPVPNTFNNGVRPRRGSRSGSELSWTDEMEDVELEMEDFLDERTTRSGKTHTDDLYELIPIDHGYCFPTKLFIEDFDWAWFHCAQIAKPIDPAVKEYMLGLDIEEMLRELSEKIVLPEETLFLLRVVHQVLVDGINRGLTLRDIAGLIARTEEGKPSAVEKLIAGAEDNAIRALEVQGTSLFKRPAERSGTMKSPPLRRSPVTVMQALPVPSPSRAEPSGLRRVICSELQLSKLSNPDELSKERAPRDKVAYLSSENIQRLQASPVVGGRSKTASGVNSPSGDYFMKDLDLLVADEADGEASLPAARPVKHGSGLGAPLSQMKSLDGHYHSGPFSADPRSYLGGSWLQATDSELTSEASSSDFGFSPRGSKRLDCMQSPLMPVWEEHCKVAPVIVRTPSSDEVEAGESAKKGGARKLPCPSRRRQRSDTTTTTTDDELDNESECSGNSDLALVESIALARVTSFGALQSPPLYDIDIASRNNRQLHLLKRARERGMTRSSAEYASRRFKFASAAVGNLVLKEASLLHAK